MMLVICSNFQIISTLFTLLINRQLTVMNVLCELKVRIIIVSYAQIPTDSSLRSE